MLRTLFLFLLLFFFTGACQPDGNTGKQEAAQDITPPPPVDEDALMLRLSADLVAEPQTQAQQDRNDIINYAIDHLLEVQSTPSGLYYQVVTPGEGEKLQWGDRVRVHYRGYFLNGKEFDSSYRKGKPLEFYIGNMIDGWNEGLQLLAPGARAILLVPSHLGYGEEGIRAGEKEIVPPNKVLIFELEVLEKLKG